MIQNDMKVNIDDDQPQQKPNDRQTEEESVNSPPENFINQDMNENDNSNEIPINQIESDINNINNDNNNDINNDNNASESTTYSFKPENSKKKPLIIRLRNPSPDQTDYSASNSPKSKEKTEKVEQNDSTDEIPDEDKWKCPICLDALQQPVVTRCGHVFCWPCIHEWLRRSNTCPVCHGEIEESHLIPIYGQGDEADISSPPPPRPEYREARPNNGFNFAFTTPFGTRNLTGQIQTLFQSGPYLIVQILAILFLFISFYV